MGLLEVDFMGFNEFGVWQGGGATLPNTKLIETLPY
jgi:hypothetical protein